MGKSYDEATAAIERQQVIMKSVNYEMVRFAALVYPRISEGMTRIIEALSHKTGKSRRINH